MYWRRSLIVTVVILVLAFGVNSSLGFVYGLLARNLGLSTAELSQIYILLNLIVSGVLHFIVLWAAFRYYASPLEKRKRANTLRADDVLNLLSEDELAVLRQRLLPPSQRDF
jgi:uncharacterized BrkB/YihY/UPF0761 family membrane protein